MKNRVVSASALHLFLMASSVLAAEQDSAALDFVLRAGGTYSDNIGLQPSGLEESGSALVIGAELKGTRPVGRLQYETELELSRYQYLDYYSGGQTFGRGQISGSYGFVPEHFRWNAGLNFDQMREELFRPLAPGNVEDVITFSTGPTLRGLLFGAVDTQLDAQYVRAWYTGETFDNQTIGARLLLGRQTGRRSSFGVGGSIDDVSYLSGVLSSALDFQRKEAFLHGELTGVRTSVSGEFGYSEANGDTFDGDGPLARLRIEREMSPFLTAFVAYSHEFPTSQVGRLVTDGTPSTGGVIDTALVSSAPRESRTGEIGFSYERSRSTAMIGFYHVDEKSLIAGLGEHQYDELRTRLTRLLSPRSKGTFYASYSKEEFSAFSQDFEELRTGVEYGYDFTRSIGIDVRVEYRSRDDSNGIFSYDEVSAGAYIRYTGSAIGRNVATPRSDEAR